MINYFTPEETRDFPKSKKNQEGQVFNHRGPSSLALQFVFGYAAALNIVKTKSLGNLKLLVN